MNFKVFLLIFALPIFLSKYSPIFIDISVKSKYRYIHNYRYFFLGNDDEEHGGGIGPPDPLLIPFQRYEIKEG